MTARTLLLLGAAWALAACTTSLPPAAPPASLAPSAQTLVQRYDAWMLGAGQGQPLPAVPHRSAGHGQAADVLEYRLSPGLTVAVEVDPASGRPFSFNVMGFSQDLPDSAQMLGAMRAVGHAVYGEDGRAALVRTCSDIAHEHPGPVTGHAATTVRDLTVYCDAVEGLWIAGITARR